MVKHLIATDRNICKSVIQTNLGATGCRADSEGCWPLGVPGVINTLLSQVARNGESGTLLDPESSWNGGDGSVSKMLARWV